MNNDKIKGKGSGSYEEDGTAHHYQTELIETIEKIERVYGTLSCILFCEMNKMRYRDRLGNKEGESPERDLIKIQWYDKKSKELQNKSSIEDIICVPNSLKRKLGQNFNW